MSSDDDEPVVRKRSRVCRPSPAPITFEGKRYEQIKNGELPGLGQRTGLMAVIDEAELESTKREIVSERRERFAYAIDTGVVHRLP